MATLPTLVTAMAKVDGRDRKSVEHIGRVIREAGYIPTGKRGGGAVAMTKREAANLIIALNGADTPQECPLAIDRFRSLVQMFAGNANDFQNYFDSFDNQPEAIQSVADSRTFGQALECLVDEVPSLVEAFYRFAKEQFPTKNEDHWDTRLLGALRLEMFGVSVEFSRYSARVEVFVMNGGERLVQCVVQFIQDQSRGETFYGTAWPDRRVKSTIGAATLIAAWQAMHPGQSLPGIPAITAEDEIDE